MVEHTNISREIGAVNTYASVPRERTVVDKYKAAVNIEYLHWRTQEQANGAEISAWHISDCTLTQTLYRIKEESAAYSVFQCNVQGYNRRASSDQNPSCVRNYAFPTDGGQSSININYIAYRKGIYGGYCDT